MCGVKGTYVGTGEAVENVDINMAELDWNITELGLSSSFNEEYIANPEDYSQIKISLFNKTDNKIIPTNLGNDYITLDYPNGSYDTFYIDKNIDLEIRVEKDNKPIDDANKGDVIFLSRGTASIFGGQETPEDTIKINVFSYFHEVKYRTTTILLAISDNAKELIESMVTTSTFSINNLRKVASINARSKGNSNY